MKDKLLSGLFWVLLLNIIVKPLWILGIEVGVQNAVGAEAYGLYFSIFNLAYIFNILLDFGVTNYNTRNIAQHPVLIQKHLGGILSIKLALLGVYMIIAFSAGLLLGYTSREFMLLLFLTINQFLNSLILYLRSNFEGLLLFKWDSVLSVMDRVLMIVICGTLLYGGFSHFTIFHFVLAQTAAYLATAAMALAVLVGKTGLRRLRFNRCFTIAILKQSAPFALLVLLMACYNRIDPLLLNRLAPDGDYQAGIYAGAFRLLDALSMIAYLVSVPLLPIYSKLTAGTPDKKSITETTQTAFSLVWIFSTGAATTLAFLSEPLMGLLYKNDIGAYADVFVVLIFGIIPISFTYIFGTLLTAGGQLRQLNRLAASTLVLNVVLNVVLIPRYGAQGSAWASLGAQTFMALSQSAVALHGFKIGVTAKYICRLSGYVVVMIAANLVMRATTVGLWTHLATAVATALLAGIAFRLCDIKSFIQSLKKEEEAHTKGV